MKLKRILVVDDDKDDQQFFCDAVDMIEESLFCKMAGHGREALQHLEFPPPYDMIFLDLNMPVMNGYETLAILKSDNRYKHIPVVILSTSHNPKDIERCKSLGADKYLIKPFGLENLVNSLKEILAIVN